LLATASVLITAQNLLDSCVTAFDVETDYFPEKAQVYPMITSKFTVQYRKHFKIVEVVPTNEKFILYQCGTSAPSSADYPGYKMFQVPIKKAAVLDTTLLTYLELLGKASSIKYAPSSYVTSPCIQKAMADGSITALGWNSTQNKLTLEADSQVGLVLTGSVSTSAKFVAVPASSDPGALNRAEWVKFIALFFNMETSSMSVFDQIRQQYSCLSSNTKMAIESNPPTVAWISYQAKFGTTPASWFFDNAPYKVNFITAAGANPFTPENGQYIYNTKTDFLDALKQSNIDIVIDLTWQSSQTTPSYTQFLTYYGLDTLAQSDLDQLKFIKNKQVWRVDAYKNANGGDGWFENAVALPENVLNDIVSIVNPSGVPSTYKRTWFRNVAKGEEIKLVGPQDCVNALAVPGHQTNRCFLNEAANSGGLTGGAIAGIVIGCIVGTIMIGAAIFYYYQSNKKPAPATTKNIE